jgi:hypothetical protein
MVNVTRNMKDELTIRRNVAEFATQTEVPPWL